MEHINATIDDKILHEFRDVIYKRKGLRKGDFQQSLEEAMLEYVLKYSKSHECQINRLSLLEGLLNSNSFLFLHVLQDLLSFLILSISKHILALPLQVIAENHLFSVLFFCRLHLGIHAKFYHQLLR